MTSLSTSDIKLLNLRTMLLKAEVYIKCLEIYKADYVRTTMGDKPNPDRCAGELRETIIAKVMSLPETERLELFASFVQKDVSELVKTQIEVFALKGTNDSNCLERFDKCVEHVKNTTPQIQAEIANLESVSPIVASV